MKNRGKAKRESHFTQGQTNMLPILFVYTSAVSYPINLLDMSLLALLTQIVFFFLFYF